MYEDTFIPSPSDFPIFKIYVGPWISFYIFLLEHSKPSFLPSFPFFFPLPFLYSYMLKPHDFFLSHSHWYPIPTHSESIRTCLAFSTVPGFGLRFWEFLSERKPKLTTKETNKTRTPQALNISNWDELHAGETATWDRNCSLPTCSEQDRFYVQYFPEAL